MAAVKQVEAAHELVADLQAAGIEVLYDDRDERAGVKFKDADLIGLPVRLTVGERSLQSGGVELKRRDLKERRIVALGNAVAETQSELAALQGALDAAVVEVPYKV